MIRSRREAARARGTEAARRASRSAAASIPPCSRICSSSSAASSAACACSTSITACRPRARSGAGTARAWRAPGACRSSRLTREHPAQAAASLPKPPRAMRATHCCARPWSRAKCWSPRSIATTRSKRCCFSCFAARASRARRHAAIAPFGPGRIARPLLDVSRARDRSAARASARCAGSRIRRTPTRASRATSCASDSCR